MEQKKILSLCPLFSGLTEAEMGAVLREMQVKEKDYEKGEILLFAGGSAKGLRDRCWRAES